MQAAVNCRHMTFIKHSHTHTYASGYMQTHDCTSIHVPFGAGYFSAGAVGTLVSCRQPKQIHFLANFISYRDRE